MNNTNFKPWLFQSNQSAIYSRQQLIKVTVKQNNVSCLLAQDMENISEDDGWEFVNLGDQQSFGIKTAGLEEKATACQMLVSKLLQ